MKYKVWDDLNGEQDEAVDIEADSAREAAVEYAEQDTDGQNEGLYHERLHTICVLVGGVVEKFDVSSEPHPVFRASRVPHV